LSGFIRLHLKPRAESEQSTLGNALRSFTIASATILLTFKTPFTQKYFSRAGKRLRAGVHKTAQAQYPALWEAFKQKLEVIPSSHRSSFPLWLDHFDNLWLTFTPAIPSAVGDVKLDVSLYESFENHGIASGSLVTMPI
jgi:hypothetical protein